jgi:hypothetical protein
MIFMIFINVTNALVSLKNIAKDSIITKMTIKKSVLIVTFIYLFIIISGLKISIWKYS